MEICTVKEYIRTQSSLDAKIAALENLISEMLLSTLDSIDDSGTASYSMDDGQMKVTTEYRSIDQITKGIRGLEKTLQLYINQRNGHVVVLRGRKNY